MQNVECNVVKHEVVKNTEFNTLKAKVNNLKTKILEATTLIYINQYNNKIQRKKSKMLMKNTRYKRFSGYNCFE